MLTRCLVLLGCCVSATAAPSANPEAPAAFVALAEVDASIRQDIRYFGTHNFVGARIEGYEAPRCILTRPAAAALMRVQAELRPRGLSLKVFDCYRPQRAVSHFMRWAADATATRTRAAYYPQVTKPQLISEVYVAEKSGHSRGGTADLTIVRSVPGPAANPQDGEDGCGPAAATRDGALDMGSGFDCFDPVSNTNNPSITAQQHANRLLLKSLMERHGFKAYQNEWWHFTLADEPFPERYFDFVIR